MATSKVTKQFKCNNCEDGIHELIVKETGNRVDISTKKCNKCQKEFGLKGIQDLEFIGELKVGAKKKQTLSRNHGKNNEANS